MQPVRKVDNLTTFMCRLSSSMPQGLYRPVMGLLYLYLTVSNSYYMELKQSSPISGLDRSRDFQEVKVPIFRDNGTGWW